MKKKILILLLAICTATFGQKKWVAASSGAWETAENWSGGTVPTSTDDVILDNTTTTGPYTVTMIGNGPVITIKSLQIGYTGNTNTITFEINNAELGSATTNILTLDGGGTAALHVMDNGVFTNSSTNRTRSVLLKNTTDVFKMSSNGKYIHNIENQQYHGSLPATDSSNSSANYNFTDDSSVEISLSSGVTTNLKADYALPEYNNFIVRSPSNNTLSLFSCTTCTNNTLIKKNLTINGGVFTLGYTAGGTLTINGNVFILNVPTNSWTAKLRCAGGAAAQTLLIKGDVSGDGTLNTNISNCTGLSQITLEGNLYTNIDISPELSPGFPQNPNNYIKFSGGTATNVEFNATTASSIKNIIIDSGKNVTLKGAVSFVDDLIPTTLKSITINNGGILTVASTGILNTGVSEIKGAGTLVVDGTLGIGSDNATDAFATNVYPTTVSLNPTANIVFNGSVAQNIAAHTFPNFTLDNTNGATLNGIINVTDKLTITASSGALNLGTFSHDSKQLIFDTTPQVDGSWGSTVSTATNKDNTKFAVSGTGLLNNNVSLSKKEFKFGSFQYYPNPVENMITLNLIDIIDSVEVFNMLGQKVLTYQPNTITTQLDLSSLKNGVYILKVTSNGKTEGVRIIKN